MDTLTNCILLTNCTRKKTASTDTKDIIPRGKKRRRRNLFGEFNFDQVDSLSDLTLLYQLVVFVFGSKFFTFEAQKVVGIYINFLALRIFFIKNL